MHGTGLNPGNLSGVLPLALSGMSRSIEKITLQERADWSFYESTHITFDNMRFGRPPEEVTEEASDFLRFNSGIFMEEVALIGEALGAGLDDITSEVELTVASVTTTSSGSRSPPAPSPDSAGTGVACAPGAASSRSRRSGPSAASTRPTGPPRWTDGR